MYLKWFGLNEEPFGVTPDPRFLYMGPSHREALASLLHSIQTGRGFMTLIAEPGMGKTTIISEMLERTRTFVQSVFLFQTQCTRQELLRYLLSDLGVQARSDDIVALHEQFSEILVTNHRSGKKFVLVIDEAQNLTDDVLESVRLLSDFETQHEKLLQIILSGQPQLELRLSSPEHWQLRQRMSAMCHLQPLSVDEVLEYIETRLRIAGRRTFLFTPEAVEAITLKSGGIPRIVNNYCFNLLCLAYALEKKEIDADLIDEVASDLDLHSKVEKHGEAAVTTFDRPPRLNAHNRKEREFMAQSPLQATPLFVHNPSVQAATPSATLIPMPSATTSTYGNTNVAPTFGAAALAYQRAVEPDVMEEPAPFAKPVTEPKSPVSSANILRFDSSPEQSIPVYRAPSYQAEPSYEPPISEPSDDPDKLRKLFKTKSEPEPNPTPAPVKRRPLVIALAAISMVIAAGALVYGLKSVPISFTTLAEQAISNEPAAETVAPAATAVPAVSKSQARVKQERLPVSGVRSRLRPPATAPVPMSSSTNAYSVNFSDAKPSGGNTSPGQSPLQHTPPAPSFAVNTVPPSGGEILKAGNDAPMPVLAREAATRAVVAGRLIKKVVPIYPSAARYAHIEGAVHLTAKINSSGEIEDVVVDNGPAFLAEAAKTAVKQWRYTPFTVNGKPVPATTQVTINFHQQ